MVSRDNCGCLILKINRFRPHFILPKIAIRCDGDVQFVLNAFVDLKFIVDFEMFPYCCFFCCQGPMDGRKSFYFLA